MLFWPLTLVGVIATFFLFLGGFVYVSSKRNASPRAAYYASVGLFVLLVSWLLGFVVPGMASRYLSPTQLGTTVMPALHLVRAIARVVGIGSLLFAIFTDRDLNRQTYGQETYLPGDQRAAPQDRNPYVASPVESE